MEQERRRTHDDDEDVDITVRSSPPSRSLQFSPPPSAAVGANYILHTVSKFDTLAGVAIKYGVEVADIKRLNGLVTDLQMFALKTIRIPLPGRHPPSPSLCSSHDASQRPSSSEQTRRHSDLFDSFPSLKLNSALGPPATRHSLPGYYDGLRLTDKEDVYRNGAGAHFVEQAPFSTTSSSRSLNHHRKSKSVANGLMLTNGGGRLDSPLLAKNTNSSDKWMAKLFRRRQKSEAINLLGDSDDDNSSFIRKSSSTSSLPEDSSAISSIWSNTSRWNLKPDFQALSSAAIPKPIMSWMNKAAID